MNLVIDIGNTRLKYGYFLHNKLLFSGTDPQTLMNRLETLKNEGHSIDLFISESGEISHELKQCLKKNARTFLEATPLLKLPIEINYGTPHILGFDRIANAVAANSLFPNQELLVIDAGTAITFDHVSADNSFQGGNISPGYNMRFKALHDYTHKLPYLQPFATEYEYFGSNTHEAITNGVMNGILFEVKAYVSKFLATGKRSKVILTGGNSDLISRKLDNNVCLSKDLGLIGLNLINEYNKRIKT